MGFENNCAFVGRLGQEAVVRNTGGEKPIPVANFSIAVNEKYGKKESTTWVNVVAFNGLANVIQKYTKTGTLIGVKGRLQNRKWTNEAGEEKFRTEIISDSIKLLESKGGGSRNDDLPPLGDDDIPIGALPNEPPVGDDDIPF